MICCYVPLFDKAALHLVGTMLYCFWSGDKDHGLLQNLICLRQL